jgi:hypothetical protein
MSKHKTKDKEKARSWNISHSGSNPTVRLSKQNSHGKPYKQRKD